MRRLTTLCSALSLLLCAAVCMLWVESYWANRAMHWVAYQHDEPRRPGDVLYGPRAVARLRGNSCYGWFHLGCSAYSLMNHTEMPGQPAVASYRLPIRSEFQRRLDGARFGAQSTPVNQGLGGRGGTFDVVLPYWVPAALFGALPAAGLRRWRRNQRRNRRRNRRPLSGTAVRPYPRCENDLRASPGRCPKCGASPAAGEVWREATAVYDLLRPLLMVLFACAAALWVRAFFATDDAHLGRRGVVGRALRRLARPHGRGFPARRIYVIDAGGLRVFLPPPGRRPAAGGAQNRRPRSGICPTRSPQLGSRRRSFMQPTLARYEARACVGDTSVG